MKIQILWPTKCPWQKDFKRPKDFRNVTGEDYTKTYTKRKLQKNSHQKEYKDLAHCFAWGKYR